MLIASYIVNFIGLFAFVLASMVKGEKMGFILFLNFCGNALIGIAYLLGGNGINGALSSFLGGLQAIVTYFFESRGKALPKWLIGIYALSFIVVNLWLGALSWLSTLAIAASMCYVMKLIQKSGKAYRFWALSNSVFWCVYDLCSRTYGSLAVHVALLLFTAVGMLLHDLKKSEQKE